MKGDINQGGQSFMFSDSLARPSILSAMPQHSGWELVVF